MYANPSHDPLTSDCAARLTDLALEVVAGASTTSDSVATELQLWHTLEAELDQARRAERFSPVSEVAPRKSMLLRAVSRAANRVSAETPSFPAELRRRAEATVCRA